MSYRRSVEEYSSGCEVVFSARKVLHNTGNQPVGEMADTSEEIWEEDVSLSGINPFDTPPSDVIPLETVLVRTALAHRTAVDRRCSEVTLNSCRKYVREMYLGMLNGQ